MRWLVFALSCVVWIVRLSNSITTILKIAPSRGSSFHVPVGVVQAWTHGSAEVPCPLTDRSSSASTRRIDQKLP
jgi:hypothetical protein